MITIKQFLDDMQDEYFPCEIGKVQKNEDFDPQFTKEELKEMAKYGIIALDKKNWTFQLTIKATRIKKGKDHA